VILLLLLLYIYFFTGFGIIFECNFFKLKEEKEGEKIGIWEDEDVNEKGTPSNGLNKKPGFFEGEKTKNFVWEKTREK
jgi:hypothetical protein